LKNKAEEIMNLIEKQLEQTLQLVRSWPPERQEDAVQTLLAMHESGTSVYRLNDDERKSVETGLAQALRGERVGDDVMDAFFKRHGL
jgi:hypothetical protein